MSSTEKEKKSIMVVFNDGTTLTTNYGTAKEAKDAMQIIVDAASNGDIRSFMIVNAFVNMQNVNCIMLCPER